jgi:hypothetical protein
VVSSRDEGGVKGLDGDRTVVEKGGESDEGTVLDE